MRGEETVDKTNQGLPQFTTGTIAPGYGWFFIRFVAWSYLPITTRLKLPPTSEFDLKPDLEWMLWVGLGAPVYILSLLCESHIVRCRSTVWSSCPNTATVWCAPFFLSCMLRGSWCAMLLQSWCSLGLSFVICRFFHANICDITSFKYATPRYWRMERGRDNERDEG